MRKLLKPIPKIIIGASLFLAALIFESLGVEIVPLILYILALILLGHEVFISAVKGILRRDLLDEKFLMSIASIGAMLVGEYNEGVAIMLFYLIGETFEHFAVKRSRASVKSLMELCPDTATVLTDEGEEIFDCEEVEVGSTIVIRPGERVPIDCIVLSGTADADTSMLTGESAHRPISVGDTLDSGAIILGSRLVCKTLRPHSESCASRILELVENASDGKAREERFITKFSRVYTPCVVGAALLLVVFLPIFAKISISDAVYRALIFLVVSCPCALVISVPMAFFGGIGCAARNGILFKGANIFSPLSKARYFAFDKTGTLTKARLRVSSVEPVGVSEDELLSLVRRAEYYSNHPVAEAVKRGADNILPPDSAEEIVGEGVLCQIGESKIFVGNMRLMKRLGVEVTPSEYTALYCVENSRFVGKILLTDTVKEEAAVAISSLRTLGVEKCIMISGDRERAAAETALAVGIDGYHAEITPEGKYELVKALVKEKGSLVFVGDGINDSPSLAAASVGIAMGGVGQDAAIEAADLIIVSDNLEKIPKAIKIARKTGRIAKENIVIALGVKLLVMLLGAVGIANMWLAVFADVGVAVIAILNSMRMLISGKREK